MSLETTHYDHVTKTLQRYKKRMTNTNDTEIALDEEWLQRHKKKNGKHKQYGNCIG